MGLQSSLAARRYARSPALAARRHARSPALAARRHARSRARSGGAARAGLLARRRLALLQRLPVLRAGLVAALPAMRRPGERLAPGLSAGGAERRFGVGHGPPPS